MFIPKCFSDFKFPLDFSRFVMDGEITLARAKQSNRV